MLAKINAPATVGVHSRLIEVECDISNGLPSFVIVGLADKAVDEAKERVRGAMKNSNLVLPPKRITLNLAPADLPKDGTAFDLPMAVAVLASTGQIKQPENAIFAGELALNGDLRPIKGALSFAQAAYNNKLESLFLPKSNSLEAALVSDIKVYPVSNLKQLYRHLIGEELISSLPPTKISFDSKKPEADMSAIYGQEQAKRALEIAAAGGHNLLFSGPPGSGKTLLSKALVGILPKPSMEEIIEINQIHGLTGVNESIITSRPFRTPHHTASHIALIGGGKFPRPGEITLSHRGVLFLDELPEFPRNVLEVLRQPLEDHKVTVARASGSVTFPAEFMLIATQNPCPCGFAGDQTKHCSCTPSQIQRYRRKVSGPLLDRIDIIIEVPRVKEQDLVRPAETENSASVAARVAYARELQFERFSGARTNAQMDTEEIRRHCELTQETSTLAQRALSTLNLSARAYMRVLKVARTIADLERSQQINPPHLSEALQYRARA